MLFFAILIVLTSAIYTSEPFSFNWRAYVPSSTMSTVWPFNSTPMWIGFSAICTSVFLNKRSKKVQQEAAHKKELLNQLRKYVHAANGDFNQFGSADDMAFLAATNPDIVRLLPGELSNNYDVKIRQDGVLGRRIKYLRSDEIWGEVEKALQKKAEDTEFAHLTVEENEFNSPRALYARALKENNPKLMAPLLSQLLAPCAKAMRDERARQQKESDREIEDAKNENPKAPLTVDHEWEMSPDTWNKHYIEQGLQQLGFRFSSEHSDWLYREKNIWFKAQDIVYFAKDNFNPADYSVDEVVALHKNKWSINYKPLVFTELSDPASVVKKYTCTIDDQEYFDPIDFFNSTTFLDLKSDVSTVYVYFHLPNNSGVAELYFTRKNGLLHSCQTGYTQDKDNIAYSDTKPFEMVQAINRTIMEKTYLHEQKKQLEKTLTECLNPKPVERDPETEFVDPWLCPRLLYPFYFCAKFVMGSNRVALSTKWLKSDKKSDNTFGPIAQTILQDEFFGWYRTQLSDFNDKAQSELILNVRSTLRKDSAFDGMRGYVHEFCIALDGFNKRHSSDNSHQVLAQAAIKLTDCWLKEEQDRVDKVSQVVDMSSKENIRLQKDKLFTRYDEMGQALKRYGVRTKALKAVGFTLPDEKFESQESFNSRTTGE